MHFFLPCQCLTSLLLSSVITVRSSPSNNGSLSSYASNDELSSFEGSLQSSSSTRSADLATVTISPHAVSSKRTSYLSSTVENDLRSSPGSAKETPLEMNAEFNPHQLARKMLLQGTLELSGAQSSKCCTTSGSLDYHPFNMIAAGGYGSVYLGKWGSKTVAFKTVEFVNSPSTSEATVDDGRSKSCPASTSGREAMYEAGACLKLEHSNIVATYDVDFHPTSNDPIFPRFKRSEAPGSSPHPTVISKGEDLWRMYLVHEYCDSGTLTKVIDEHRIQNICESSGLCSAMKVLLSILLDISKGLEHAHGCGVLHGDINPNNVLLQTDPSSPVAAIAKIADWGTAQVNPRHYFPPFLSLCSNVAPIPNQ
jgi:hypothetical protein